jgi:hypothetical protein
MSEENKKNATERLTDLENNQSQIVQALQPVELMARDLAGMKEALKLLNNKVDALVKAINAGGTITDDSLSKYMIENNVSELAKKVSDMVTSGLLVASDTVSKDSFVVINEADPSGTVVNPRMQFLLSALQHEEVRNKLEGAKVGSNIAVGDQGASINVLESYNVVTPQAPAADAPAESQDAQYASYSDAAAPAASDSAPAAEATPAASTTATA